MIVPVRIKLLVWSMFTQLMKFFIKGNAWTYNKLREYLEQEPVEEAKHK